MVTLLESRLTSVKCVGCTLYTAGQSSPLDLTFRVQLGALLHFLNMISEAGRLIPDVGTAMLCYCKLQMARPGRARVC